MQQLSDHSCRPTRRPSNRSRSHAGGRKRIASGFRINQMVLRNALTGESVWQSATWPDDFTKEVKITVPKSILKLESVSREVSFSSAERIEKFRLVQNVFIKGKLCEEWNFRFGLVIAGSTNTWQSTIGSSNKHQIPAEILSGNVVIQSTFHNSDAVLGQSTVRVYYE